MIKEKNLPNGWAIKPMTEVVTWGSGGTPKATESQYYANGDIPWLIISDLNDGVVTESQSKITELGLKNSSAKMIPTGTLLVAMYGSIGKLGITGIECCTNQAIAFAKELRGVSTKYMFYYMAMMKSKLISMGKGGTQNNISQTILKSLNVIVPPTEVQDYLVFRIEELFSELNKAVKTLQTTKQQLAVYRQAVLNEAFSNSESWPQYEFGKIMDVVRNGYGNKPDDSGNYRILTIGSVRSLALDLCNYRLNNQPFDECDLIAENDLLFTRYNGNKEFVGVCAVVPKLKTEYAYPDKLIKFRPHIQDADYSKYLAYYSSSGIARKYLMSKIKTTSGQNGIAGTDIKKMTIHIPSMEVIHRIVFEIESRLSVCESIEQTVDTALAQADAMRQSILKQAFEGGYV